MQPAGFTNAAGFHCSFDSMDDDIPCVNLGKSVAIGPLPSAMTCVSKLTSVIFRCDNE